MRRFIALAVLLSVAFACTVFAAGKLPLDRNRVTVQNLTAPAPDPATATVVTATVTKGTLATITTTGYVGVNYKVTDSAGTAVIVKRFLGSNTAYIPESGGALVNPGGNTFSSVAFKPYSAAPRALTVHYELQ